VVLIDEIDKADIDFPNDLLQELDQQFFYVVETSPRIPVQAKHRPLILITSNNEKPLPDAFLRRCLFFYIDFPKEPELRRIVSLHLSHYLQGELSKEDHALIVDAVTRFTNLREQMEPEKRHYGKLVSTSELIDWVKILRRSEVKGSELTAELLFPSVLLKSREDQSRYGGGTRSANHG
jgi:MoxR-like ATPase